MKSILTAIFISATTMIAAEPVDVLVVAPHPDDEVIGCTGVIMQALEKKQKVGVVVMTNGDGFPKGTAAFTRKLRAALKPPDFFELAKLRQRQSYEGIELVGLKKSDVSFLGYPDGGLAAIYRAESATPYRNKHTGKSETYGLIEKDYHFARHGKPAPYTKASILGDLAEIIRERSPSEIYVTNELDQHSDHRAAMWFVRDAAVRARFNGRLFTFIVHGKKLPNETPHRVELTPMQLAVKKAAIGVHKIPKVHDHLVDTHAKESEFFWPILASAKQWPRLENEVPAEPVEPELVTDTFDAADDFGFDGAGHIASRKFVAVLLIHSRNIDTKVEVIEGVKDKWPAPNIYNRWMLDSPPRIGGVRFRANGDLVTAIPVAKPYKNLMGIRSIHLGMSRDDKSRGTIVPFKRPQFLHTDISGKIWYAGHQDRYQNNPPSLNVIGPPPENKLTVIHQGGPLRKPRGIVYDNVRKILFFTETDDKFSDRNKILRVSYEHGNTPGPIEVVAPAPEAPARNLVLDEFGRLYAMCGNNVYRFQLNPKGDVVGRPFIVNARPLPRASSAQFGNGPGWDERSLYVICEPESYKHVLGDVSNLPQHMSLFYRLPLGVRGDPDALLDPNRFDTSVDEAHQQVVAKRMAEYPAYLAELDEIVRTRLEARKNPIQDYAEFLKLKKLGASLGVGLNHDPMLKLHGLGLTGNEPALANVKPFSEHFERRRTAKVGGPMGQHPATGWAFCIDVGGNPNMDHYSFLKGITTMDFRADGNKKFDDADLLALAGTDRLRRLTLVDTAVTIEGIQRFLQAHKRVSWLHLSCVTDESMDEDRNTLARIGTLGLAGKGISMKAMRSLANANKLRIQQLKLMGTSVTNSDRKELNRLFPKLPIRITKN